MKGDFSNWEIDSQSNEIAVLHQQGRGLLDQDWNDAAVIAAIQRQVMASDAIGSSVAAIPAESRNGFKVTQAEVDADGVEITLNSGRVWVDGFPINVRDWSVIPQPANYFPAPLNSPAVDVSSIAAGVRDAVILEVWPEALNAFQKPLEMLEPALGGVDTTERAKLYHRLRLLRLDANDECGNLADRLRDDESIKGELTVTAEEITVTGDCPVDAGGGYTGFEHYLIRVEISEAIGGVASFKWSRFNGGLVGRGIKSTTEDTVTIVANDQMINHCGLTSFYLEALQENPDTGNWEVTFRSDATLSADGELDLSAFSGFWPGGDGNQAFFRLWDGTEAISDFPINPNPNLLALGLRLQFDAAIADNANYVSGDYWVFPVRAAGTSGFNADAAWPDASRPQGINYMRVPLAILTWNGSLPTTIVAPDDIHDCRRIFQPLSQLDSCCSYTVGDGMVSHGDFESIQEAIDALPARGGEICVFEGRYEENLVISRDNVSVHGCGPGSHLIADSDSPAIQIENASQITIRGLQITADDAGIGIFVAESDLVSNHINLKDLHINAASMSAIQVDEARFLTIRDNSVVMQDVPGAFHAVFVTGDDVLIEHNEILVSAQGPVRTNRASGITSRLAATRASAGRGGLHLGGTSERVQVIDNLIQGGISNGISLGTVVETVDRGEFRRPRIGWAVNRFDPCDPCSPGTVYLPPNIGDGDDTSVFQSAGALYDIRIERNRILNFGLNGIGVITFFNLDGQDEFISVNNLQILGNSITRCLFRDLEIIPDDMEEAMGYGGISLADVDNLVIHDNEINNNGPSHLEPICGVFVLHGEGIDISRNRILNNGAKTAESARTAKSGPRGGIHIIFSTAPKIPIETRDEIFPRQNGVPALAAHDNIVSQPLGRALSATVLGPVAVHGNQFTSQGFVFRTSAPSFLAATVFIFNLGVSNEIYFQQIFFSGESLDDIPVTGTLQDDPDFLVEPQAGLDSQRLFGYLGNGNVMFNDNQVMLDLTDQTGFQLGITSVAIMTLDDLAFEDNQCDISYDIVFDEFFLFNVMTFGWTVRFHGNRIKESIFGTLYSAMTISLFANITTHNQGTHCIQARNLVPVGSGSLIESPNSILFDVFGLCDDQAGSGLLGQQGQGTASSGNQTQPPLNLLS